jgi:hypothetical protein
MADHRDAFALFPLNLTECIAIDFPDTIAQDAL